MSIITANGMAQLSYKAARLKKTMSERDRVEHNLLRTTGALFIRETNPRKANAGGQLFDNVLHGSHRLARAVSRRRLAK